MYTVNKVHLYLYCIVNIYIKFCVLMASYVINHTKCEDISPGSCDSRH